MSWYLRTRRAAIHASIVALIFAPLDWIGAGGHFRGWSDHVRPLSVVTEHVLIAWVTLFVVFFAVNIGKDGRW